VSEDQVVRTGPAVATIVAEAAAWHADVLVVGSHGKGWVDRLLIGSTTEHLLNALPASVLVIPTAAAAKQGRGTRPRTQKARGRPRKAGALKAVAGISGRPGRRDTIHDDSQRRIL
jgi:hypothetical protein